MMADAAACAPTTVFSAFLKDAPPTYVLLVLNQPLPACGFKRLWKHALWNVCADGALNHLHDLFADEKERAEFIPHFAKGDMDSVRPDSKKFYEERKKDDFSGRVPMNADLSWFEGTSKGLLCQLQDTTDLQKCLLEIESLEAKRKTEKHPVIILGALGGRLDHTMAAINQLYLSRDRDIYLLTSHCVAFLVRKGRNKIKVDFALEGPTCGLLPVGNKAVVTTDGLKWNLQNQTTEFGGLLSTSNLFAGTEIHIQTSEDVVWTCEIKQRD